MSNKSILGLVLVGVVSYFSYNFIFSDNKTDAINKTLNSIEKQVSFEKKLKKQQVFERIQVLKKFIKKDVIIEAFDGKKIIFEENSFDSIQGAAFVGANYLTEHSIEVLNKNFNVTKLKLVFFLH